MLREVEQAGQVPATQGTQAARQSPREEKDSATKTPLPDLRNFDEAELLRMVRNYRRLRARFEKKTDRVRTY